MEYNGVVNELFIDCERAYDSVRREVLYSVLSEFGMPLKLGTVVKICLNETYSKDRILKHASDGFRIQKALKKGNDLPPLFLGSASRNALSYQEGLN